MKNKDEIYKILMVDDDDEGSSRMIDFNLWWWKIMKDDSVR